MSIITLLSAPERLLFFTLLLFWLCGCVLLIAQSPHACKFFDLPTSGRMTADNPNETPIADQFYTFTHRLTLLPYTIISLLLQLPLYILWFLQLSYHTEIEQRVLKEQERAKEMMSVGYGECVRRICDTGGEEEVDLEVDGEETKQRDGDAATSPSAPHRRTPFRCIIGCHPLFSTSFFLTLLNCAILLFLTYWLFLGYGTLEATNRFAQAPTCRKGFTAGLYITVMSFALGICYAILLLLQCVCATREVVRKTTEAVRVRKERRKKTRYEKIEPSKQHSTIDGGVELELDIESDEENVMHGDNADETNIKINEEQREEEEDDFEKMLRDDDDNDNPNTISTTEDVTPAELEEAFRAVAPPPVLQQPKPRQPQSTLLLRTSPPNAPTLPSSTSTVASIARKEEEVV